MSSRNLIYPDQNYLAWFRPVRSKRRAKKIAQQNQTCLRNQLGPRRMLWMCSTTRFQSNHEESSQGTVHGQGAFLCCLIQVGSNKLMIKRTSSHALYITSCIIQTSSTPKSYPLTSYSWRPIFSVLP